MIRPTEGLIREMQLTGHLAVLIGASSVGLLRFFKGAFNPETQSYKVLTTCC